MSDQENQVRHIASFDRAFHWHGIAECGVVATYGMEYSDLATRRMAKKNPERFCPKCIEAFRDLGSHCTPSHLSR